MSDFAELIEAPMGDPALAENDKTIKVLNVDDDPIGRYATARVLRRAGFVVTDAGSGQEALRMARANPDVVILDVNMPDMSGREVCRLMKTDPVMATIPVLHLSATSTSDDDQATGLEGGADGYLVQPVVPRVLIATVKALVRLRRLEEAEREAAHQWKATFDAIGDAVCLIDSSGLIQRANDAMIAILGQPKGHALKQDYAVVLPWLAAARHGDPVAKVRETGGRESGDVQIGERTYVVAADPVWAESEESRLSGIVLIFADVSQQRLAQARVRESEEHYRLLFESTLEAILVSDESGRYIDANPQATVLTGYGHDELLRLTITDLTPPEDSAVRREMFKDLKRAGEQRGSMRLLRKSGQVIEVEYSSVKVSEARYEAVLRDVTERRAAEQLREEYVGLISHDLRNPLTAIRGQAQFLSRLLNKRGMAQEARSAEAVIISAQRMNAMIEELVDSARLETGRLDIRVVPTDLGKVLREVPQLVVGAEERSRLRVECATEVPRVMADPAYLERALVNLISNALKYSAGEAAITLTAAPAEGEVVISVRDEGLGIAEADLPRVFDRFYRAPNATETQGLGLGLYITRLIVGAHGGRIWVESELAKGSTFSIALPVA